MTNDVEAAGHDTPRKPWLLEFRSSNGFILATVCVAIFTVRSTRKIFSPDYKADNLFEDAFLYGVVSS